MSYFKEKLSQFVVNRYPRYILQQVFPYTLDINAMLGQEPRAMGVWLGLRVQGCIGVFFSLEKEDNNPCIAFLKTRLTCQ